MPEPPLSALLERLAEDVDVDGAATRRAAAVRRLDRRRRRRQSIAAATVVTVALVGGLAAISRPTTGDHEHVRTAGPHHTTTTSTVPEGPSAGALARGSWRDLPRPPVGLRGDASVVWTGTRLFVWGGSPGANGTGVTTAQAGVYDPAARTWHATPPSPIQSRVGAIAVWTGHEIVIWGGSTTYGPGPMINSGVAYDPATDTWRRLSATGAPAAVRGVPQTPYLRGGGLAAGVWSGSELVVITGPYPVGGKASDITATAYDPARDAWRTISTYRSSRAPERLEGIDAVWFRDEIVVWLSWDGVYKTTVIPGGGTSVTGGGEAQEMRTLDEAGHWFGVIAPTGPLSGPLVAGDVVVGLGDRRLCSGCFGPGPEPVPTVILTSPRNGSGRGRTWLAATAAEGPLVGDFQPQVWTGRYVVRLDPLAFYGGNGVAMLPGDIAALDLDTRAWTKLPRAPKTGEDPRLVWVGDRLVVWGSLIPSCTGMPGCSTGRPEPVPGGIELVPKP
jgi:hypothetical protein